MRDDDAPEIIIEEEPTRSDNIRPLDDSGPHTRAYKSAEFLAGRAAGIGEGIEAAVAALKVELVRAGCNEDEVKHIVARVRSIAAERR